MHLSLIGMSGSGKSYWTKKLSKHGFRTFHCDALIKKKLADELVNIDGVAQSVGEWMGFPFDAGYRLREKRYLAFEKKVLNEIFDYLKTPDAHSDGDGIIDTTGSVIYTGEDILTKLRRFTTVVHLETPKRVQDKMLAAYLKNRRPVLWRDYFTMMPDETEDEAIARCYPILMASREHLYRRQAHVTLKYDDHSNHRFSTVKFLNFVSGQIGRSHFNAEG